MTLVPSVQSQLSLIILFRLVFTQLESNRAVNLNNYINSCPLNQCASSDLEKNSSVKNEYTTEKKLSYRQTKYLGSSSVLIMKY